MTEPGFIDADKVRSRPPQTGQRLRQAREKRRMSIEDVASNLNLNPAIVAQLEQDCYDDLPSAAYAKGYIRSYARLVGLDAGALIKDNQHLAADNPELLHPFISQPPARSCTVDLIIKSLGYAAFAGLAILAIQWWQNQWQQAGGNSEAVPLETLILSDRDLDTEIQATGEAFSAETGLDKDHPRKSATLSAQAGEESNPEFKTSLPHVGLKASTTDDRQAAKTAPADTPENRKEKNKQHSLVVRPQTESWIEITDANSKVLFYKLAQPGEAVSVQGAEPFKVVIGNADSVSFQYDGKYVDLTPYTQNGVARFEVGDQGAHR